MIITRSETHLEWEGTQEEFEASSLSGKGWAVYTGVWPLPVAPTPPVVPQQVTMDQAMIQLTKIPYNDSMSCYAFVQQAKASMSEADQAALMYRKNVNRADPLTQTLIQAFGWTVQQTDEYFTAASLL